MALRGWTPMLRAAVVTAVFAFAGVGAPGAYAGNGQCVAKVHVDDAGPNNDVAFDGHYLYYSTFGENALHRVLPPGTPTGSDPTGCPTYTAGPGQVAPITP